MGTYTEEGSAPSEGAKDETNPTIQSEIISAISKLYMQIYTIDLEQGIYNEVADQDINITKERYHGSLSQMTEIGIKHLAAHEYSDTVRAFLDFDTLADRLHGNRYISEEVKGFDGKWYTLVFIPKKWNADGEVTHALYAIQDVSRQKELELDYKRQLEIKAAEAERANLAKTNFLRHMSHDIRTPLNGISGLVDLAETYADDPERLRENRRRIRGAIAYLNSLVDNVLDLSKLETENGITLEEKPFDLVPLLSQHVMVVTTQADEVGLKFIGGRELSNIRHRYLIGSAHHLNRILMNLSGNAIKYNKKDGSICAYCREIASDDDTATFQFVCEDTGIGISEEFQAHIYEPFMQEGKETFNTFTGSGLGLSFVKNMVSMMGGTIDCESREGCGTRFTVTLTFRIDKNPEQHAEEKSAPLNLNGKHAMLVDDNELNLEIAKMMLEFEGLEVDTAENGQEAIECFLDAQEAYYDFIFMDIMMPVMNGLEATRKLRALNRSDAAAVPIIAMTANAFQDDIENSLAAGMNAHLTKPLDVDKIRKTILEMMRKDVEE